MLNQTRRVYGVGLGAVLGGAAVAGGGGGVGVSGDEARAIVAEMLAEAGERSSLLGVSGSPDTDLKVGGYFQYRYIANFRDDDGGTEDFESGFTFSRVRLVFSGTVHDTIDFVVRPFTGSDGDFRLLETWARFRFDDSPWNVQVGQFKLPFWREWLLAETRIQPVERSVVTNVFSSIYAQGVALNYLGEGFRGTVAFSDGLRTLNTDFDNPGEADWAVTARGEFLIDGQWSQHNDLSSVGNTEGAALLGVAVHYQGETDNFRGVGVDHLFQYTVDASVEGEGWNLFGAFVGRHIELEGGGDADDFGVLVQGGLFVSDRAELFGRYTVLIPDGDSASDDAFNSVTAGVNYYLHGHAAKFTVDGVYYVDNTVDTGMVGFGPSNGVGLLPSTEDGQFALRAQVQLVF